MTKYVDINPKAFGSAQIALVLIENGTPEGQKSGREIVLELGEALDALCEGQDYRGQWISTGAHNVKSGADIMIETAVGADERRAVRVGDLTIPDCWHVAQRVREQGWTMGDGTCCGEMILDAWHLAHDLKKHIIGGGA